MVGIRFARIIMDPGRALSSDGFVFYVCCRRNIILYNGGDHLAQPVVKARIVVLIIKRIVAM